MQTNSPIRLSVELVKLGYLSAAREQCATSHPCWSTETRILVHEVCYAFIEEAGDTADIYCGMNGLSFEQFGQALWHAHAGLTEFPGDGILTTKLNEQVSRYGKCELSCNEAGELVLAVRVNA